MYQLPLIDKYMTTQGYRFFGDGGLNIIHHVLKGHEGVEHVIVDVSETDIDDVLPLPVTLLPDLMAVPAETVALWCWAPQSFAMPYDHVLAPKADIVIASIDNAQHVAEDKTCLVTDIDTKVQFDAFCQLPGDNRLCEGTYLLRYAKTTENNNGSAFVVVAQLIVAAQTGNTTNDDLKQYLLQDAQLTRLILTAASSPLIRRGSKKDISIDDATDFQKAVLS